MNSGVNPGKTLPSLKAPKYPSPLHLSERFEIFILINDAEFQILSLSLEHISPSGSCKNAFQRKCLNSTLIVTVIAHEMLDLTAKLHTTVTFETGLFKIGMISITYSVIKIQENLHQFYPYT